MSLIFKSFHEAQNVGNGNLLASCLTPINTPTDPFRIRSFSQLSNYQTIHADVRYHIIQDRAAVKLPKQEAEHWVEIFVFLWKCIRELDLIESGRGSGGDWGAAFKAYKDLCINLCRGYTHFGFQAWTVPCMFTAGNYLRLIAIKADADAAARAAAANGHGGGSSTFTTDALGDDITDPSEKNEKLKDAARTLQQMIAVCRTDDSELAESRKWGVISIANLLFKTYFKLNNIALTKNVIAILESPGVNLPPLTAFPKAQYCTYEYYRGILEFLRENYAEAEEHLSNALAACHKAALKNREQILTYFIPAHILNSRQLPSKQLLAPMPNLEKLLLPLCTAIKSGNLAAFDVALASAEVELVRRRIYLTLERSRDLCLRNLFRKVFLYAGFEEAKDANNNIATSERMRRTRINIWEFEAAIKTAYRDSTEPIMVDRDEVECFIANMIYKGYMKGYIAREQGKVVLSKNGAFPGTGI